MIPGQITLADCLEVEDKHKPKPSWIVVPEGYIWCPYCNWAHKLRYDRHLGVSKCSSCGISIRDYFIKKFNRLGEFYEVPNRYKRS